jgi:predicted MFS family arabinose efflux permease
MDLSAAYWFGAIFTALALLAATPVLPAAGDAKHQSIDAVGSVLLSLGLVALLLAIGQGETWGWTSPTVLALFAAAVVIIAVWVPQQLRGRAPLIELRLLRHAAVLSADAAALILGMALYLNFSLVTSFVQTPTSHGYGFDASVLTAGLCLVPFSILSLLASRSVLGAQRLLGARGVLPVGCLICAIASASFALAHDALWEMFVAMAIIGVGVGYTFAAIPGLIVGAVPDRETGSAMGLYLVVRSVGFSLGSAVAAAVLASHTPAGQHLPVEHGYVIAGWIAAAMGVLAALIAWSLSAAPVHPRVAAQESHG